MPYLFKLNAPGSTNLLLTCRYHHSFPLLFIPILVTRSLDLLAICTEVQSSGQDPSKPRNSTDTRTRSKSAV